MIYMAMATNRRIIQNAVACLNDIREDKVKSKAQAIRICVHDTAALHLDGWRLYGLAFWI